MLKVIFLISLPELIMISAIILFIGIKNSEKFKINIYNFSRGNKKEKYDEILALSTEGKDRDKKILQEKLFGNFIKNFYVGLIIAIVLSAILIITGIVLIFII